MTRSALKKFVGKVVHVTWRDPTGKSGWTDEPLKDHSAPSETWGLIVGFNDRKELIMAGSRTEDGDVSDRNAIPLALIESVEEFVPKKSLGSRRRR